MFSLIELLSHFLDPPWAALSIASIHFSDLGLRPLFQKLIANSEEAVARHAQFQEVVVLLLLLTFLALQLPDSPLTKSTLTLHHHKACQRTRLRIIGGVVSGATRDAILGIKCPQNFVFGHFERGHNRLLDS
mmetsp:Transcript_18955/g.25672  ORF Transcript_18955/g.25672 Transcript_18955/m.25672 type:complete len:132 (-) Transcript_18955:277-672(-)